MLSQFTTFDITQYGVAKENPENEALGTAMLYIFAQAKDKAAFGPVGSLQALIHREGLGHYPGMHTFMDSRSESDVLGAAADAQSPSPRRTLSTGPAS